MSWRFMRLRGQRVLARCKADGTLDADSGRVEIRYKPNDGKAYRAAVRNLERDGADLFADSHCGPATAPKAQGKNARASKAGASKHAARAKALGDDGSGALVTAAEGEAVAYADGACSGNPGPAGLGVVLLVGKKRCELSEFVGQGTNNVAELMAIQRAAEHVEGKNATLRLYTDSKYAIGVLAQGWKAKANRELIGDVSRALAKLPDWELIHVPGHAGVPLNERADELAVLAVKTGLSTGWVDVR